MKKDSKSVTVAMEAALLNRAGVTIPAKDWNAIKANPGLADLARHTPSWERENDR